MASEVGQLVNAAAHALGLPEPCEHSHHSSSKSSEEKAAEKAAEIAQQNKDWDDTAYQNS